MNNYKINEGMNKHTDKLDIQIYKCMKEKTK